MENEEKKTENVELNKENEEEIREENAELEAGIIPSLTNTEIVTQVQDSFLDYAMSVIVSRALPDVRDGLKPVHRRVIYAMYDEFMRCMMQAMYQVNLLLNQQKLLVKLWVNITHMVTVQFIKLLLDLLNLSR